MTNEERLDLIEKQICEIHYNVMKIISGEISDFCPFTTYVKNPAHFVTVKIDADEHKKSCGLIACAACNPGIFTAQKAGDK